MTDPQTPATEAGRRLFADLKDLEFAGVVRLSDYLGPTGTWRAILAIEAEARAGYTRGHWDGLHCDADTGFGILDECEHVGRIYEPKP